MYHSVGLGKNNYLFLACGREAEIFLHFFTIAHFPCFSQIEQKMKPSEYYLYRKTHKSEIFFLTIGHCKTHHLTYEFYRATIAHS